MISPVGLLLAFVIPLQGPAKEAEIADPKPLLEELRKKVEALGSVSGTIALEAHDGKGVRTPRFKGSFHLRLSESWLYLELEDLTGKSPPQLTLFDGDRHAISWSKGGDGHSLDPKSQMRDFWHLLWRLDTERSKVDPEVQPARTFVEFLASLRPLFTLELEPSGDPVDPVHFSFKLGQSTKGGVAWLKEPSKECTYFGTPDEIIRRDREPPRTFVVDRKTGFLRSIRLDLPSGESRVVVLTEIAIGMERPKISPPDQGTRRVPRIMDAVRFLGPQLKTIALGAPKDLLENWSRLGGEDRADRIRGFYSWIGAEFDALNREGARSQMTIEFIKGNLRKGIALDRFRRLSDKEIREFRDRLIEGETASEGNLAEALVRFRELIEKAARESAGSEEAKKALIRFIRDGFESDRLRKVVPTRPEPDYERILKEAIDTVEEEDKK